MTDETQPQLSPKDEQEIDSFLSEFAMFSEPEEPAEGQDYLDIGVPTAVENVQAAQETADSTVEPEEDADEPEVTGPEEPESLGATMTQDQLDALFSGDVVAAFAHQDEEEADVISEGAEQDAEIGTDAEAEAGDEPEEAVPVLDAADAPPPEEETGPVADSGEAEPPASAEDMELADISATLESEIEEPAEFLEAVVAEPEVDAPEEISAEAEDDTVETLELTDDDMAALFDDGGGAEDVEEIPAAGSEEGSVPDLSQDEIDSLFGSPATPSETAAESAELSQADIDALLAGGPADDDAEISEPDLSDSDEIVAQLEITDEELMGLTMETPGAEPPEALDLDSLAALADAEPPADEMSDEEPHDPAADAVAAAAIAMEAEPAPAGDDEIETIEVGDPEDPATPSRRLLGLPARLLAAVVAVPMLLIVVVAVIALGRGGDTPADEVALVQEEPPVVEPAAEVPAEEPVTEPATPAESEPSPEAEVVGEPEATGEAAAESVPEGEPSPAESPVAAESAAPEEAVEEPVLEPGPEAETAPLPEPEPLEPAPTPPEGIIAPAPEPADIEFPEFTFSDPAGDGFNPRTGEPRLIIVPAADILNLSVATTDLRGSPTSGLELTADGFAGAAAGTEVTVVFGASPGDLTRGTFRLSLNGRFASATAQDLAPDDSVGLPAGSQLAINVWKEGGTWRGEQVTWNRDLGAAVRVGQFTSFSVRQNRINLTIPTPLLFLSMPEGVVSDVFQFYVGVEHISDSIAISDFIGHDTPLQALDPLLVDLTGRIASGQPTHTPEFEGSLDDFQTRVLLHNERRALGLLSITDPQFRLTQPVSRL